MAKRIVYTCDYCLKEADEDRKGSPDSMELWLHLNCSFIKKVSEGRLEETEITEKTMMGDFCSANCLEAFVEKNSQLTKKKKFNK